MMHVMETLIERIRCPDAGRSANYMYNAQATETRRMQADASQHLFVLGVYSYFVQTLEST
jgi:hypothetical protein